MQPIYDYLIEWNKKTDSFAKVQGIYVAAAVALFLLAAIISLINQNLGQSLLFYAIVAALVFVGNGVVWALIRTFIVPRLVKTKPVARKK